LDLYDSIKDNSGALEPHQKPKLEDDSKFSRKKFGKLLQEINKKMYPYDPLGKSSIYKTLTSPDHPEEVRIKMDENLKKFITREMIDLLRTYEKELEIVYLIYIPENFNSKMGFSWQEIKFLEKKLPILAVLRFLWDCEIIPTYITPGHFIEVASRVIPPLSVHSAVGQK
jgi:hypothetical protein